MTRHPRGHNRRWGRDDVDAETPRGDDGFMAFENIGKLKSYIATGGSFEHGDVREAALAMIDELEALRGQLEAQKLLIDDLTAAATLPSQPGAVRPRARKGKPLSRRTAVARLADVVDAILKVWP